MMSSSALGGDDASFSVGGDIRCQGERGRDRSLARSAEWARWCVAPLRLPMGRKMARVPRARSDGRWPMLWPMADVVAKG
eukprot:4374442-Prymnesium_polylepis.1